MRGERSERLERLDFRSHQGPLRIRADALSSSHVAAVNRLAWRQAREGRSGLQLASCSDDRSVRVFDVELDTA
jgi:WD40 repeat protein